METKNPTSTMTDLGAKFNKNIRPLLDAVDSLRSLNVTSDGIPLPTIVVVGDQSSGKSSVLESLATISLPRGQGIATRVPLVLRLQSCRTEESSITIMYKDQSLTIEEQGIKAAVDHATNVIAGKGKGVTDTPNIRKPNAPDLTMIDLPGITRVPVHGQPDNIYEQIAAMIRHYLKPKETVILNVLSATVDFSTCESIHMSQQEDKRGERTLAVVTKVDRLPEGVYEKVTADDVNIGLGYICVRNRTDDNASHEEAREKERVLFETHPSLSQLDKGCVGIASLAERLTQIQANIIRLSLPGIKKQIDKALAERQKELESFMTDYPEGDPTDVFLHIVDENKNLLQDVMLYGNYDKFAGKNEMHWSARVDEMFQQFSTDLNGLWDDIVSPKKTEEILKRTSEMRGLSLPNFLSPVLMKRLVSEELDKAADFCTNLVIETHEYGSSFVLEIIDKATSSFPNLQAAYKQVAATCVETCRGSCTNFMNSALEKERSNVFTLNASYMANVQKIKNESQTLKSTTNLPNSSHVRNVVIDGFAKHFNVQEAHGKSNEYQTAWDMKVSLAAYLKVVHKRMADEICLEIKHSLESVILKGLRNGILKTKMGHDMSNLMEEHAANVQKKTALRKRVHDLKAAKAVVQKLF